MLLFRTWDSSNAWVTFVNLMNNILKVAFHHWLKLFILKLRGKCKTDDKRKTKFFLLPTSYLTTLPWREYGMSLLGWMQFMLYLHRSQFLCIAFVIVTCLWRFFKIECFWYSKLHIESRFLNFMDEKTEKLTWMKRKCFGVEIFWGKKTKLLNKLWAKFLLQYLYIRVLIMLLHRYSSRIEPQ